MPLEWLSVTDIRSFAQVDLDWHPRRNVIRGPNASGKTSLLEAVHLLATGRSFRPGPSNGFIREGRDTWRVVGRVRSGTDETHILGIERNCGKRWLRIDGRDVGGLAALAEFLPVEILTPESHYAFLSDPNERRRALNWGLFHVEQNFLPVWRAYQRALQQRNAALRAGRAVREFTAWDEELVANGERLQTWRVGYVEEWRRIFLDLSERLIGVGASMSLLPGWADNQSLATTLAEAHESDLRHGYTQFGPHRADVRIDWEGAAARSRGSHGQQKLLVTAARLAQAVLTSQRSAHDALLLIDDLAAELDLGRRQALLALIAELPGQVIVTAVDTDPALAVWRDFTLFHVEQGRAVKQA